MSILLTPTAQAGLGTSPPAIVIKSGTNDATARLTFGTGTSPAAGALIKVAFAGSWASTFSSVQLADPVVMVMPENAATAALGPFYCVPNGTGLSFTLNCTVSPTASQANTVYQVSFVVANGT